MTRGMEILKGVVGKIKPKFLPVTNGVMRIILLFAKFVFIVILAKHAHPETVVQYGILVATVSVATTFLGLDFYTFSTREIMKNPDNIGEILTNQVAVTVCVYMSLIPFIFVTTIFVVPIFTICAIISTEHISQELIRVLIARRKPLLATLTLAPKAGLWIVALLIYSNVSENIVTLDMILIFWFLGNTISLGLGVMVLRRDFSLVRYHHLNVVWIKKGIKAALILLGSGVLTRCLFLIDRILMQNYAGIDVASAYILFSSIFASINVVVEAVVFNFALPDLVEKYNKVNLGAFLKYSARIAFNAWAIAGSGVLSIVFFSDFFLLFIGKEVYSSQKLVLYSCAILSLVYVSYTSLHYILYSMGQDLALLLTAIATVTIFSGISLTLSESFGPLSVVLYLITSLIIGVVIRLLIIYNIVRRNSDRIQ